MAKEFGGQSPPYNNYDFKDIQNDQGKYRVLSV